MISFIRSRSANSLKRRKAKAQPVKLEDCARCKCGKIIAHQEFKCWRCKHDDFMSSFLSLE